MAAGNLLIFGAHLLLMLWLMLLGVMRFSGFVTVRADLDAMRFA
jgi:hypothetical protein